MLSLGVRLSKNRGKAAYQFPFAEPAKVGALCIGYDIFYSLLKMNWGHMVLSFYLIKVPWRWHSLHFDLSK